MHKPFSFDAEVVESVRFPSGSGWVAGELAYPETRQLKGAAILAGPHPQLGGSRRNNVIRALGDGLAQYGMATLRFDYRSQMEGEHGEDLCAAVAFLSEAIGANLPLALIGYSFGCALLPLAIPAGRDVVLMLIAPVVGTHDLEAFAALQQPKLVIAPRNDFAIDEAQLPAWFDRLAEPKEWIRPDLDGHFFRGHEAALVEMVSAFCDRQWRLPE